MAEQSSSEDRTEEPTARRLQTAREDGEVAQRTAVGTAKDHGIGAKEFGK